ncbi:phosphatase PAP2 family protein [Sutterella sp.]|uniref:phosphatase PAP2 family protein n=1 Tax=Sutterella sp. TaxID=1981025 RepID=UPI0026E05AFF|nr:phosphatase PAP2 family protein [Sutterella sp.]MDO5532050.1 phosphatase PAP2 family protein [Sutterella sp.]
MIQKSTLAALFAALLAAGTVQAADVAPAAAPAKALPQTLPEQVVAGEYLGFEDFLPAPPEKLGEGYAWKRAADERAREAGVKLRATARGDLAKYDAESALTEMREIMLSEVIGMEISEKATPAIHRYLDEAIQNARKAMRNAKAKHMRDRPFAQHPEDETCRPDIRDQLNAHVSYPSGHTITAWTAGLVLSSVMPSRGDIILKRMYEAGESRWICGHHWQSDVEAGRNMAAAAFAFFVSRPDYPEIYAAARAEADALIEKKNN